MGGKEREMGGLKLTKKPEKNNIKSCYREEGHKWTGNQKMEVCINCGETRKP